MERVNRVVLGTRGSDLARTQAQLVEKALGAAWPSLAVDTKIITTRGDETAAPPVEPIDRKAGRKGLFTSEIERALRAREIDVAVHSAKDLPSEQAAGLEIAATLPRGATEDVLVCRSATTWESLPSGAMIATGSIRRRFQLQAQRPDVEVTELRGNVPTRLRKLAGSDWGGIILARVGLERLGFDLSAGEFEFEGIRYHCALLDSPEFLSAGGQGIIALQVRTGDPAADLVGRVNDAATLLCLRAEREFLRLLDGDCDSPVGVGATIEDGLMTMRARVFKPPAVDALCGDVEGPADAANILGLAAKLLEQINGR